MKIREIMKLTAVALAGFCLICGCSGQRVTNGNSTQDDSTQNTDTLQTPEPINDSTTAVSEKTWIHQWNYLSEYEEEFQEFQAASLPE